MNDIQEFLESKKPLHKDNFISEAIDAGFRIAKKPEEYKYTDVDLKGMTTENRDRTEKDMETMPDFVLVNPENKMVVEVFTDGDNVKQANAVFKYSFPATHFEHSTDIQDLTRGLGLEKFHNGRVYKTESVMLRHTDDLTKLSNTVNNSQIQSEQLSLDKDELSLLTFMQNKTTNSMQMQFKMSQILGSFNQDIVDYKTHYNKRRKLS